MIYRRAQALVADRLRTSASVVLLGPRQVGKTTLARSLADDAGADAIYLDLESAADQRRLTDPEQFLGAQRGKLVVIDEIHRAPGLFPILRGLIDDRRRAGDRFGQFLLLGTASLDLMRQSSESLAGRTSYIELAGIDAGELPAHDEHTSTRSVETLWVRAVFLKACSRMATAPVSPGGATSCARISSAKSRCSRRDCRRQRSSAAGVCWRMVRVRC